MNCIKIEVTGNVARVTERPARITAGTVGLPVEFSFDSQWDGLAKTAVFRACRVCKISEGITTEAVVPWEVLKKPGEVLLIGVYGTNKDGSVVIPTTWANVCNICESANPGGDASTDTTPSAPPTPSIWDKILLEIGNLSDLSTDAKENLVDAINEVYERIGTGTGGGGGDGVSPIVNVVEIPGGHRVTITDINGDQIFDVMDGEAGPQGPQGPQGIQGVPGEAGPAGPASNGVVYYNVHTNTEEAMFLYVEFTGEPDWEALEFFPEPKKGDMVISASGQLFVVAMISETGIRMMCVKDLNGEGATVEEVLEALPDAGAASFVKNGNVITASVTMDDGSISTSVIELENGLPKKVTTDGVECPMTFEGFDNTDTSDTSDILMQKGHTVLLSRRGDSFHLGDSQCIWSSPQTPSKAELMNGHLALHADREYVFRFDESAILVDSDKFLAAYATDDTQIAVGPVIIAYKPGTYEVEYRGETVEVEVPKKGIYSHLDLAEDEYSAELTWSTAAINSEYLPKTVIDLDAYGFDFMGMVMSGGGYKQIERTQNMWKEINDADGDVSFSVKFSGATFYLERSVIGNYEGYYNSVALSLQATINGAMLAANVFIEIHPADNNITKIYMTVATTPVPGVS